MNWKLVLPLLSLSVLSMPAKAFDVKVLSATVKSQAIDDAELVLQKDGEDSISARTDKQGKAHINKPFGGFIRSLFGGTAEGVDDSTVTMTVKKKGYSDLVVKCPCSNQIQALSPTLPDKDAFRIVLLWDEKPADLNAYLTYAGEEVSFAYKKGENAHLDIDDIDSFGPETITLDKRTPGQRYFFAVHSYMDGRAKDPLKISSSTKARVFLYSGNTLVRRFSAPEKGAGDLWLVFDIGSNGEIHERNYYLETIPYGPSNFLKSYLKEKKPSNSISNEEYSRQKNLEGEKAYKQGNFEEAAKLFNYAISRDTFNAQAHSNLGLTYRKLHLLVESTRAHQSALDYGRGDKRILAISYYNLGRFDEEMESWNVARRFYEMAQKSHPNEVYGKAIARMNSKLQSNKQ